MVRDAIIEQAPPLPPKPSKKTPTPQAVPCTAEETPPPLPPKVRQKSAGVEEANLLSFSPLPTDIKSLSSSEMGEKPSLDLPRGHTEEVSHGSSGKIPQHRHHSSDFDPIDVVLFWPLTPTEGANSSTDHDPDGSSRSGQSLNSSSLMLEMDDSHANNNSALWSSANAASLAEDFGVSYYISTYTERMTKRLSCSVEHCRAQDANSVSSSSSSEYEDADDTDTNASDDEREEVLLDEHSLSEHENASSRNEGVQATATSLASGERLPQKHRIIRQHRHVLSEDCGKAEEAGLRRRSCSLGPEWGSHTWEQQLYGGYGRRYSIDSHLMIQDDFSFDLFARMAQGERHAEEVPRLPPKPKRYGAGKSIAARYLWCSWCVRLSKFKLYRKRAISRDIFECTSCGGPSVTCVYCGEAMARNHENEGSDKLCLVCSKFIGQWPTSASESQDCREQKLSQSKYCSWCFAFCAQDVVRVRLKSRTEYQCSQCSKKAVRCRKCETGLARMHSSGADAKCAVCSSMVPDWSSPEHNRNATSQIGWCSWCFVPSTHYLEQKNKVVRSIYSCNSCNQRTLLCTKCKENMARGGANWDDNRCSQCCGEVDDWEKILEKKNAIFSQMRDRERTKSELERDSIYREKAMEVGMIRPFLLLVSMAPAQRNQVACSLGWTVITKRYFGDCHAESWKIINRYGSGIRDRTSRTVEQLTPSNWTTWYDTVRRVTKFAFKETRSKNIGYREAMGHCCDSESAMVGDLEEEFLERLIRLQRLHMTRKEREEFYHLSHSAQSQQLCQRMQATGIKNYEVAVWGANMMYQTASLAPVGSVAAAVVVAIVPGLGVIMAPVGLVLGVVSTPIVILGFIPLIFKGLNMAFGSSHGRLLPAVMLILQQRLFLAAEGFRLEDYY
jgi:hypothetical protein